MWKHKTKHKGHTFLGNYEWTKNGIVIFKLKNAKTGRELAPYSSYHMAKRDGWIKCK